MQHRSSSGFHMAHCPDNIEPYMSVDREHGPWYMERNEDKKKKIVMFKIAPYTLIHYSLH